MKVAACTQERAGCHIHTFRTVAATSGETVAATSGEQGDLDPGPFGAKGCGEGAPATISAAVVNAPGRRRRADEHAAAYPERVWRPIQELKTS
jgi:hypothetical protein